MTGTSVLGGGAKFLSVALFVCGVLGASNAVRADIFAHWPLDDGDGGDARNLAPDGEVGFIHDWDIGGLAGDESVWVDDPERGTVLGLAGTSAWVEAGHIPVMDLENQFSWSFWARQPPEQDSPSNDIIIGNRWSDTGQTDTVPREFIKFTPNRFEIHYNGAFGNDMAYADTDIPSNDQWLYHSVVKEGDSLAYYRNGQLRNSRTIPEGQSSSNPLPLAFGGQDTDFWRGHLSDVQLYESALTSDQLQSTMSGTVLDDANLYAHYKLDEGDDAFIVEGTGPGAVEGFISDEFAGLGPGGSVWVDDPERGTVLGVAGAWVDAGELPFMDLENDFTWTFWARSDPALAAPNDNIIVGNSFDFDGTDTDPPEFIKITADRVEFHMNGTGSGDLQYGPGETTVPSNDQWIHHVGVKDGDELFYYRDGELTNSRTLISGMSSPDPLPFALGGQHGGETWQGFLSDVRLFDHPLTEAEVAELAGVEMVPGDCNEDGILDVADLTCVTIDTRDMVLDELSLLPGDFDGTGGVAFADFLILSSNFGDQESSYTAGDIDLNGAVEFADFLVLSTNFGMGATAAAVPEPASCALLGSCVLGLGLLRRGSKFQNGAARRSP